MLLERRPGSNRGAFTDAVLASDISVAKPSGLAAFTHSFLAREEECEDLGLAKIFFDNELSEVGRHL